MVYWFSVNQSLPHGFFHQPSHAPYPRLTEQIAPMCLDRWHRQTQRRSNLSGSQFGGNQIKNLLLAVSQGHGRLGGNLRQDRQGKDE